MPGHKSQVLPHDDPVFKIAYWYHRERRRKARSFIDKKPRPLPLRIAFPIEEMKESHSSYHRTNDMNMNLIKVFNKLNRGADKKTTKCLNEQERPCRSKLSLVREKLCHIEIENRRIASKILKTKSLTNTGLSSVDFFEDICEYKVPPKILIKYRSLVLPQEVYMLEKLLRPKIYMDIAIKGLRPVGRVFAQLFTEACPELVLELVHYCTFRKLEKLEIIRIFPSLWIEAELQCRSCSALKNPNFEHEMNVQSHLHPGVFSFSTSFLEGFQHGLINFTISFRPLHVANGTRVVFGLITKGQRIIDVLQDYGTKNGVTKKDIIVINSGRID